MQIILGLISLIAIAIAVWGVFLLSNERRQSASYRKSLRRMAAQVQSLEEDLRTRDEARNATEEKLRGYLELLDTLINAMPNPIYFKDAVGVFQGCNRMFARSILGLTRDKIIGRRSQELTDVIPPDLAAGYQREELKMMEKLGLHSFEAPVQCADGLQRDYLFSLAPVLDQNQTLSGWVVVLSDLTDKNRTARVLLQKEKLEGVLETAGAVCHEMNQPLQAASGYTELVMAKINDREDILGNLMKIMGQIERMRDITDKLQGITRYETMTYIANSRIIDIRKASS